MNTNHDYTKLPSDLSHEVGLFVIVSPIDCLANVPSFRGNARVMVESLHMCKCAFRGVVDRIMPSVRRAMGMVTLVATLFLVASCSGKLYIFFI